jgi:transcriptional regulator GlxA family with amidase domain
MSPIDSETRRQRGSKATLELATSFLDARGNSVVRVAELCKAIGCSERTLRSAFVKFYGVGPHRYLYIRRLHLVRAALLVADSSHETVIGVTARLGINDAGRMAKDYLELFGEYPSATLARKLAIRQGP